MWPCWLLWFF